MLLARPMVHPVGAYQSPERVIRPSHVTEGAPSSIFQEPLTASNTIYVMNVILNFFLLGELQCNLSTKNLIEARNIPQWKMMTAIGWWGQNDWRSLQLSIEKISSDRSYQMVYRTKPFDIESYSDGASIWEDDLLVALLLVKQKNISMRTRPGRRSRAQIWSVS